ncbi:MAG TPA: HAD family phosphatase [Chitinophagaceae bacterium]|nr:HAD family phosphatase [Chitinophagaceae bacterium]
MNKIRNVIFDLGGVILNIDIKRTETALKELGIDNLSQHLGASHITSFFKEYEAGKIDDTVFIQSIKALSSKALAEEAIIDAWNALLLDFPQQRIDLLQRLKNKYRLFLLSNTNSLHHRRFQQQLYQQTGSYLEDIFEKTYYSHTIGLCKPDVAAFQFVINDNKLLPEETLFVDDTEANMAAAKKVGLQVWHIKPGTSILEREW